MTEATSSTNIKVITRHSKACRKSHPEYKVDYKKCNCRKAIYIYENGKDMVISAKTRTWDEANRLGDEQRELRDPVKRKVREIEERQAAKESAAAAEMKAKTLTIVDATERWLKAQKGVSKCTSRLHRRVRDRIRLWAADNNIKTVAEVTTDNLDKWRGEWGVDAEKPYNRLGTSTQSQFQKHLKNVFRYVVDLGYLEKSPAAALKHIKAECKHGEPLNQRQVEELLAAIPSFCASQGGILHDLAAEMDAVFSLQRYTGLRIGDAVAFQRSGLVGNRISLITQKTGAVIKDRIIPDAVAAKLAALPEDRPGFRKGYFFWLSGNSDVDALRHRWQGFVAGLSKVLNFTSDSSGEPMPFHSHMLRDTFAVELLLQGVDIVEVAQLLTHESITTTEKYYAPWVQSRLNKMERNLIAAMRGMGMAVSVNPAGVLTAAA